MLILTASAKVPRKDPTLNDAIEALDRKLLLCGGDTEQAFTQLTNTEQEFVAEQLLKVAQGPGITGLLHFLCNYFFIKTKEAGFKPIYPLWDSQMLLLEIVDKKWRAELPIWLIILKARQLGISTLVEAILLYLTIFNENWNSLLVADEPTQTEYLFEMARNGYESLPWFMKPERRYDVKGHHMVFDREDERQRAIKPGLKSQILAESANQRSGSAYGKTILSLHASEVPKYKSLNILTEGILPTVPEMNKHAFVVLEGVALRRHDDWHRFWKAAEQGKTTFEPLFIEWFRESQYARQPVAGWKPTRETVGLYSQIKDEAKTELSLSQLYWYERKRNDYIAAEGDDATFLTQYPSTAEEAFQNAGICAFNKRKLHQMLIERCRSPKWQGEIRLDDATNRLPRLSPLSTGRLQVWEWPEDAIRGNLKKLQAAKLTEEEIRAKYIPPDPGVMFYLGGDPSLGVPGGDPACFDDQTEILTRRGFIPFSEVRKNESVASFSSDTEQIEWQVPTSYIARDHNGLMIRAESQKAGVNFCVTADHDMVLRGRRSKKYYKVKAEKLVDSSPDSTIPRQWAPVEEGSPDDVLVIPDGKRPQPWQRKKHLITTKKAFCVFIGLFIAEGSFHGKRYIRISQAKYVDEVRRVLTVLGWEWSESVRKTEGYMDLVDFSIGSADLYDYMKGLGLHVKAREKRLPSILLDWGAVCLNALLTGLMLGDGSMERRNSKGHVINSRRYHTTSKGLADDIQMVACLLGLPTTINEVRWKGSLPSGAPRPHGGLGYCITFQQTGNAGLQRLPIKQINYVGKIYCVSVPNGAVIVRRGGKPMVCGNCWQVLCIPSSPFEPLRQIACWHGFAGTSQFARIGAALGYLYGSAELCPEANGIGQGVIAEFKSLNYPNMYVWRREDKRSGYWSDFYGWSTTIQSKQRLISKISEAIDNDNVVLRDADTLDEFYDFVDEGGSSYYSVSKDGHGDRAMALFIGFYCANQLRPFSERSEMRERMIEEKRDPDKDFANTDFAPEFDKKDNSSIDFALL